MKHSSRDINGVPVNDEPLPNLNAGRWYSKPADLIDRAVVEEPLIRDKLGRSSDGLLRLSSGQDRDSALIMITYSKPAGAFMVSSGDSGT
jgi:hypothetical protein